jgi:septum site-determining protein MinD
MGNGVVFAVAGSKGGVGKTTTSINLSTVLSETGYDVVLVELDLAMANVGDFLDIDVRLEGEDPTLHEVLGGTVSVVDATYDAPGGFDVLPSGATLRGFVNADVDAMPGVLETLRFAYDVVVLDTGAGVMPSAVLALALADETVLVSSPRVASVRDTKKTRDLTRQVGGSVAGVVFVRSGTGRSPGVDHIADFLSVDLLGHVPEDTAVADAQDTGRPVVVAERDSDAAAAYRALGERVAERVDALGATRSTVLSADRLDGEGSGFAFVDSTEEDEGDVDADDTDDVDTKPEVRPTGVVTEATNGRPENGTTAASSSIRTNGEDAGPRTTAVHDADAVTDEAGTAPPETTGRVISAISNDRDPDDDEHEDEGDVDPGTVGSEDIDGDDAERVDPDGGASADVADRTTASARPGDDEETDAPTTASDDAESATTAAGDDTGGLTDADDDTGAPVPGDDDTEAVASDGAAAVGTRDTDADADADADEARNTEDDAAASTRSTPRRFIDRAIDLVDRRND